LSRGWCIVLSSKQFVLLFLLLILSLQLSRQRVRSSIVLLFLLLILSLQLSRQRVRSSIIIFSFSLLFWSALLFIPGQIHNLRMVGHVIERMRDAEKKW